MIVANWDYKITASKAVDAYKTATKYFEKYGSIGTALQNHIGRDTGLYTFFAGFNNKLFIVPHFFFHPFFTHFASFIKIFLTFW